ncbi:putative toxin-antitoxin system toxin component, PIN family [Candidatus Accumulibacter cognatus]|uniref:Toxin-antitoxin system toxin component, PIN family n=1 Tax=Candidatus Accumulibacter cognatus TaxID=2954383 RepID=A0A080M5S6_9PROT|nr:putative toxin-antitoxin system toxin component, PIN family [Candidatus Accumulibacter cognatus]KFB76637.1 MAG: putative toxin-antitoxin system toxin component, PIN family [Candidatus Accumulibacter cognatus]
MRAVLDTNIVMDLLHFADPRTQALQRAIMRGALRCFTDRTCLSELERVSAYPQFKLDAAAQRALLERYRSFASACDSDQSEDYPLPRCRDSDDQKFLILALRCRADLLITRDRLLLKLARHRHLPVPCKIVTAEATSALLAG